MPLRTPRGSARGRGQSKKQARRGSGGSQQQLSLYPCCSGETKDKWSIACLSCNTWYHASCLDITDEEMRCWTSTDQEYLCRKCRGGFDKGIQRLEEASHQGIQQLIKSAEREALLCRDATVNMTDLPDTYASVDTDMNAVELMRRHDIRGRPLITPGDGNCLFNSISIILTRSAKMASELRYKTCIQMATRKDRVLEGHRNIDDLFIVSPDYDQSLIACARDTEFSSAWTILGLSQVLQRKVISVYPPENGPCDKTANSNNSVWVLSTRIAFVHSVDRAEKGKGKDVASKSLYPN